METKDRYTKLVELANRIREEMLGETYEGRQPLLTLLDKVRREIREIENSRISA